jgi:hypothetical protein
MAHSSRQSIPSYGTENEDTFVLPDGWKKDKKSQANK